MRLRTVPVTFADAKAFITDWHRHHRPPVGHKFSIGVATDGDVLVGVAVVGRPVARHLDDGLTLPATPDIRSCGIALVEMAADRRPGITLLCAGASPLIRPGRCCPGPPCGLVL